MASHGWLSTDPGLGACVLVFLLLVQTGAVIPARSSAFVVGNPRRFRARLQPPAGGQQGPLVLSPLQMTSGATETLTLLDDSGAAVPENATISTAVTRKA